MPIDFKLPELGENITSGDIVNVLVREGDTIAANDGVVELETDKAVVEIPCPHAGKIAKIHVKKGADGKSRPSVGDGGGGSGSSGCQQPAAPSEASAAPSQPANGNRTALTPGPSPNGREGESSIAGPIPAGPAARRIARELGVDLQNDRRQRAAWPDYAGRRESRRRQTGRPLRREVAAQASRSAGRSGPR